MAPFPRHLIHAVHLNSGMSDSVESSDALGQRPIPFTKKAKSIALD